MIVLDVFSDTVCPWCYIGKRRLERALAARPEVGLEIHWRSFQLNPGMPHEGMERQAYLEAKFGGAQAASATYARVAAAGEEEGIPFAFDSISRTPNSIASHRLIRYAAGLGMQDAMVQRLFDGYFVEGRDIGDLDTLAALAEEIGLRDALAFLQSGALTGEIVAEDAQARRIGIQGVPCFIFNHRHVISGAQPPEVFCQLFDLALAEAEKEADQRDKMPPSHAAQ